MAIANVGDYVRTSNRLCRVIDRTEQTYYYEELFTRERFQVNVVGNYPLKLTYSSALMLMERELHTIKKKAGAWIGPASFRNIEWLLNFVESELRENT
jgi:hypothetical protein